MLDLLGGFLKPEHRFAQGNLSAYLDGELRAGEKSRIERHLSSCAECRQELATLRQTVDLLRLMPEMPLPRSFLVSAEAGREAVRRPAPAFFALRTASAIVTTLLVLVSSGNLLLSSVFAPAGASLPTGSAFQAAAPASQTLVLAEPARVAEAAAPSAQPTEAKSVATEAIAQAAPQPTVNLSERAVTAMKAAPSAAVPNNASPAALATPAATPTSAAPPAPAVAEGTGVSAPPLLAASPAADAVAAAGKGQAETVVSLDNREHAATDSGAPARLPVGVQSDVRALLNGAMWMLLITTVTLWVVTAALHRQQH